MDTRLLPNLLIGYHPSGYDPRLKSWANFYRRFATTPDKFRRQIAFFAAIHHQNGHHIEAHVFQGAQEILQQKNPFYDALPA